MFDSLKASLTAVEVRLEGALAQLRSEISAVEARLARLEQDAVAPLDEAKALAVEAAAGVTRALAPVRAEASALLPPSS